MANEQAKQVLQQGIAAARAGQQDQARQYLQEAVKRDPQSETAWLWLSSVARDDKERTFCLKQLLNINPNNENAIKGLRQLGALPGGAASAAETAMSSQAAGTPVVDDQKLSAIMPQLDPLLSAYQPVPAADLPFQWTKKRRGRVGDASAMMLRAAAGGIAAVVVLALLGGGLFVASKLGAPIALFTTPTFTPTLRPTFTPTPGLTNTPSPTPFATLPASETPNATFQKGDIFETTPTAIYPSVAFANERIVKSALDQASKGNYDEAIKTLETELNGLANFKNENYYNIVYYMAKIYVDSGNPERAIALLNTNKNDAPSYNAALAYALYAQGNYDDALTAANDALKADPQLEVAALTASRVYMQQKKYPDARRVLQTVLEKSPSNALLLVERAKTYLGDKNYRSVDADTSLALYIDPLNREAALLHIQALLDEAANTTDQDLRIQRYGTAVLAVNSFMVLYPSDTVAWKLLGDARIGEGNIDQALQAYSQAVAADTKSQEAFETFLARGNLYMQQRRYQDALDDFTHAIDIKPAAEALQGRVDAAIALGNVTAASNDITMLLNVKPDDPKLLVTRAELYIRNEEYDSVTKLLTDKVVSSLPETDQPLARVYRSVARFKAGDKPDQILPDLTAALERQEIGLGHYYRGQIYEAMNQPENAIADYDWLLYWNQVYNYSFIEDVVARLEELRGAIVTPTPTETPTPRVTPTKTPRGGKPTRTPSAEPTEEPTESVTDTPSDVPTDVATDTPLDTPTRTPTRTPKP